MRNAVAAGSVHTKPGRGSTTKSERCATRNKVNNLQRRAMHAHIRLRSTTFTDAHRWSSQGIGVTYNTNQTRAEKFTMSHCEGMVWSNATDKPTAGVRDLCAVEGVNQ